jgi:hypothetical protein
MNGMELLQMMSSWHLPLDNWRRPSVITEGARIIVS